MAKDDAFGCRRLEIYKLGRSLAVRIHAMTRTLPCFEDREEGSQVRRSSKSVTALIVEGYRLRKYRDEFLHYLHRAAGSADETKEHLDYLHETGSWKDRAEWTALTADYDNLLGKLSRFIVGVERDHSRPFYLRAGAESSSNPKSGI